MRTGICGVRVGVCVCVFFSSRECVYFLLLSSAAAAEGWGGGDLGEGIRNARALCHYEYEVSVYVCVCLGDDSRIRGCGTGETWSTNFMKLRLLVVVCREG